MRPDVTLVLERTLAQLAMELMPTLQPSYRQGTLGVQLALLAAIREEFDRAAARRVEENQALRSLLSRGAELAETSGLAERLHAAADTGDRDLQVSALQRANDELRALLIELQTELESRDDGAARTLAGNVWDELRRSTERRVLSMGPF